MHHNFLPIIVLRIHAKRLPPPLRYRQLVLLLELWERDDNRGLNCRALAQAAHLTFGLSYPFTPPEAWPTTTSDHTFDVVQLAEKSTGGLAKETHMPLSRSRRWPVDIFLGRGLERRR